MGGAEVDAHGNAALMRRRARWPGSEICSRAMVSLLLGKISRRWFDIGAEARRRTSARSPALGRLAGVMLFVELLPHLVPASRALAHARPAGSSASTAAGIATRIVQQASRHSICCSRKLGAASLVFSLGLDRRTIRQLAQVARAPQWILDSQAGRPRSRAPPIASPCAAPPRPRGTLKPCRDAPSAGLRTFQRELNAAAAGPAQSVGAGRRGVKSSSSSLSWSVEKAKSAPIRYCALTALSAVRRLYTRKDSPQPHIVVFFSSRVVELEAFVQAFAHEVAARCHRGRGRLLGSTSIFTPCDPRRSCLRAPPRRHIRACRPGPSSRWS